jgi:nitrogen regulatory protein P-II 1
MKFIIAVIRPEKLDMVQQTLGEKNIHAMTVSQVWGCGRQRGYTQFYRGQPLDIRLLPKLKVEIAVPDDLEEAARIALTEAARSVPEGKIGDGKIFVLPLEDATGVRTGETGARALVQ